MSDKLGGISLEDLMAAAAIDDNSDSVTIKPETIDTDNKKQAGVAAVYVQEKTKTDDNKAVSSSRIGGVSLDEIMEAAGFDDEPAKPKAAVIEPKTEPVKPVAVAEPVKPAAVTEPKAELVKADIAEPESKTSAHTDADTGAKAEKSNKVKIQAPDLSGLRSIYLIDVIMHAVDNNNWGLIAWIAINMFFIIGIFAAFGGTTGLIIGIVVYFASLVIALSPVGEGILRRNCGCVEIHGETKTRLNRLFSNVYHKAKVKTNSLPDDIRIFINNDDESENAFATGRKTVCVTKGLLNLEDEKIEAILGHEFGHLANGDTGSLLIVVVGNLIVSIMLGIIGILLTILEYIAGRSDDDEDDNSRKKKKKQINTGVLVFGGMKVFFTVFLMALWTKIGALFCLRGGRTQEHLADRYACELGYADALSSALTAIDNAPPARGFFATLMATHPETAERIMRIKEYKLENK